MILDVLKKFYDEEFFPFFGYCSFVIPFIVISIIMRKYISTFLLCLLLYENFKRDFMEVYMKAISKRELEKQGGFSLEWIREKEKALSFKIVKEFDEKYFFFYAVCVMLLFGMSYFYSLADLKIVFLSQVVLVIMLVHLSLIYCKIKINEWQAIKKKDKIWLEEMENIEKLYQS